MTGLVGRLREVIAEPLPLPGAGNTASRHARLMEAGREDLSLGRLAEAHWDALSILAEAQREPEMDVIYGVWASEIPGQPLTLEETSTTLVLDGRKRFCSGAGIVDRVLMTVGRGLLVDIDLRRNDRSVRFDDSDWKTAAFAETNTATAIFRAFEIESAAVVGCGDWYLSRPGFWHGACGPAACWAGGAAGLLDYALEQKRDDPHTLAHLGAMAASVWGLRACLDAAGREIDREPSAVQEARIRALTVRHLVEQACTDVLRRIPRAYGPQPLAMDAGISRRCMELDLYLRQSHAERDLEALGRDKRQKQARGTE